jgi:hypothetical protein
MESQTRFNLNAALRTWREELAAQPHLSAETRRELETHVIDTIAEMRQRGLNEEESFWLARRRVGQPKELGQEFASADPPNPAREWVLWIAVAFYVMNLWQNVAGFFWTAIAARIFRDPASIQIASIGVYIPVALLGMYLARSHSQPKWTRRFSFIRSRGRLLAVSSFLVIQGGVILVAILNYRLPPQQWVALLTSVGLIWSLVLLAIILWLLSSEKSRGVRRA